MEATKKNLLILHLTVFVWGFTGVLGKLISIDAVPMVWYRVLIAAATLLAWFLITKKNIKITKKQFIQQVLKNSFQRPNLFVVPSLKYILVMILYDMLYGVV